MPVTRDRGRAHARHPRRGALPRAGRGRAGRGLPGRAPPLAAASYTRRMAATPRQERKIVTILFADLVGFTSRAESLDPEDVVGILEPYHAHLRSELERFGGTVEKFIGDAVMAVFGAPVAHEDDAERAVRAALAIRDWAREQGELQLRVAVNTGEALVTLDARPEEGRGIVAGDVVNTAARLQSAAPVNGVLVGEATRRATGDAIEYREAAPVEAKGKAQPVAGLGGGRSRARASASTCATTSSRRSSAGPGSSTPCATRSRARAQARSPQLVTLVGVPGIGKSRLVHELLALVEHDAGADRLAPGPLAAVRRGRQLTGRSARWSRRRRASSRATTTRLRPTSCAAPSADLRRGSGEAELGRAVPAPARRPRRRRRRPRAHAPSAFPAWRRFFEALAERSPTVLVFEDLHWADDGLLDFVDHLVDWAPTSRCSSSAPRARSCSDAGPAGAAASANASTLSLAPLTDEETGVAARLPARALGARGRHAAGAARPRRRQPAVRGAVRAHAGRARRDGDLPLPETVQGIIAARLDGLDAAGEGAAPGRGGRGQGLLERHALGDRQARPLRARGPPARARAARVRRAGERASSVAGETEYAFRHVLVRDVAYDQIPRAGRAAKHEAAARWIESLGAPRGPRRDARAPLPRGARARPGRGAAGREPRDARRGMPLRDAGDRALSLSTLSAWSRRSSTTRPRSSCGLRTTTSGRRSCSGTGAAGSTTRRSTTPSSTRRATACSRSATRRARRRPRRSTAGVHLIRGDRAEVDRRLERALALAPPEAVALRAYLLSQVSRIRDARRGHRAGGRDGARRARARRAARPRRGRRALPEQHRLRACRRRRGRRRPRRPRTRSGRRPRRQHRRGARGDGEPRVDAVGARTDRRGARADPRDRGARQGVRAPADPALVPGGARGLRLLPRRMGPGAGARRRVHRGDRGSALHVDRLPRAARAHPARARRARRRGRRGPRAVGRDRAARPRPAGAARHARGGRVHGHASSIAAPRRRSCSTSCSSSGTTRGPPRRAQSSGLPGPHVRSGGRTRSARSSRGSTARRAG